MIDSNPADCSQSVLSKRRSSVVGGFLTRGLITHLLVASTQQKRCIEKNTSTAGLEDAYGQYVDDRQILREKWKVGMKVSKIDFCIDTAGSLENFQLHISDYVSNDKSDFKLQKFGEEGGTCSSVRLAKDEKVESITVHYNKWRGKVSQMDFETNYDEFSIGSKPGTEWTFNFDFFGPFIGFYAIQDYRSQDVEEIGVYTDVCTKMPAVSNISGIGGISAPTVDEVIGNLAVEPITWSTEHGKPKEDVQEQKEAEDKIEEVLPKPAEEDLIEEPVEEIEEPVEKEEPVKEEEPEEETIEEKQQPDEAFEIIETPVEIEEAELSKVKDEVKDEIADPVPDESLVDPEPVEEELETPIIRPKTLDFFMEEEKPKILVDPMPEPEEEKEKKQVTDEEDINIRFGVNESDDTDELFPLQKRYTPYEKVEIFFSKLLGHGDEPFEDNSIFWFVLGAVSISCIFFLVLQLICVCFCIKRRREKKRRDAFEDRDFVLRNAIEQNEGERISTIENESDSNAKPGRSSSRVNRITPGMQPTSFVDDRRPTGVDMGHRQQYVLQAVPDRTGVNVEDLENHINQYDLAKPNVEFIPDPGMKPVNKVQTAMKGGDETLKQAEFYGYGYDPTLPRPLEEFKAHDQTVGRQQLQETISKLKNQDQSLVTTTVTYQPGIALDEHHLQSPMTNVRGTPQTTAARETNQASGGRFPVQPFNPQDEDDELESMRSSVDGNQGAAHYENRESNLSMGLQDQNQNRRDSAKVALNRGTRYTSTPK